jgi:chromosome partitioning protein
MARIFAVANQKGGVGKTSTAVNLAASLAAAERRVLVVDMDPQANASSGLGWPPDRVDRHVYEALLGEPAAPRIVKTELANLDLLPAHADLVGAEIELVAMADRQTRLRQALAPVRGGYEFVFVDCPPSLGLLTLNALVAADEVLIPLQCEYYALEGLARLLGTIDRVRAQLNPVLVVGGVLLCMVDPRLNLTQQVEREVREHLDGKVFQTVIPRNVRISESPSFGKPILLYDIDSRGCQSYLMAARELLARVA